MKSIICSVLLVVSVIVGGCSTEQGAAMPKPTTSEYFQTLGGGFIQRGDTLKYALVFQVRKPINGAEKWYAIVQYENPEDPNRPLTQLKEYAAETSRISLDSDELTAIKNHKTYKITVSVFSDSARSRLLTTHEMYVRFDVPDKIAPSFGVKLL